MTEVEEPPGPVLLSVEGLRVVQTATGRAVVDGSTFQVRRGETVALVGESGSGKSVTARSILGLLPTGLAASGRAVWLGERDLLAQGRRGLQSVRGAQLSLLLQDPFTTLNPLTTIGSQLAETLRSRGDRRRLSRAELTPEIVRRLAEVGIEDSGARSRYPFELSGGMRQRVGLAAAIAKDPLLLITDEPTTALDATTQREVLQLLRQVQVNRGMGLLLITHDLRVAFSMADKVVVMKDGVVVEQSTPRQLRDAPATDYATRLLAAELPLDRRLDQLTSGVRPNRAEVTEARRRDEEPILRVIGLEKTYRGRTKSQDVLALRGIDLELRPGRSLGVVGESGSGKSTLVRSLLGLEAPTGGSIRAGDLDLSDYAAMDRATTGRARQLVQCVFQDPYSTLNPAHSVGFVLAEAVRRRASHTEESVDVRAEVGRLLDDVGLPRAYADRRPVAMSGGQRQRVAIARALAMRPHILLCDEPVAALDLTVQAQVLQLLRDVQEQGISLLFVTHDLAVVRQMTDDLVVLYRGEIVERGTTAQVLDNPRHGYTERLIGAVPTGSSGWLSSAVEVPA